MQPFHTIAIPHDDILQGRLTLDVFAADLWEAHHGRGPEEYRDPTLFFQKTYMTAGLRNLLEVVEKRLKGQGGDPVIQMQTPFGGGKTHSLIALYHRARGWDVRPVVISGTPLAAEETLWGLLAEQLTGTRAGFEGLTAPGRDALKALLEDHQPVLVLMDEVLEYVTKAAGVTVGESTLAAQTLAFLQELTEAAATLARTVVVVTLPSSALEHYGEQAERSFEQLKKISGRVEKVFTPVQDGEVGAIIRRRLFVTVDEQAAAAIVNAFVEQAAGEAVLSRGEESAAYRARFRQTYPFLPEVVDVLYHRWGSFPTFQRTRGTLRLLALVVHALKSSAKPYLGLGDFDLNREEIRRELLKHIGNEHDSVLASDITGNEAGARKVNQEIGQSYQGLQLGERIATTAFMYSFLGGGGEGGATLNEIKRQNLMGGVPAGVVAEVLQKLSTRLLFYLHEQSGRYFFSTTANLNRALLIRMESLDIQEVCDAEKEALRQRLGGRKMKTYLWPGKTEDIPDDESPKLLILPQADPALMRRFIREKGQTPRVHGNTLFFLTPLESERVNLQRLLRRHLALSLLTQDRQLSLTAEQRKQLAQDAQRTARDVQEQIGAFYRLLYLPGQNDVQRLDTGIPTYGTSPRLDECVYERLRTEGRLMEKVAPVFIKERYLVQHDYVETKNLAESGSRTPGEMLAVNRDVWEAAIAEGVRNGLFGLGKLRDGRPVCDIYKQEATPAFAEGEILLRAEICQAQQAAHGVGPAVQAARPGAEWASGGATAAEATAMPVPPTPPIAGEYQQLRLNFEVPKGKVSNLMGVLNYLQSKYQKMAISLRLENGTLTGQELEERVREAFRQMGSDVEIGS